MKRVLIADDVATNLRLVSEILKNDYEIITAKSGEQALHVVSVQKPDVIILDIGMPKMDGYAVMEKLRANPETESIPVIFLTAETSKEAEAKAFDIGAIDYIRKPFEPVILKSRLERVLKILDERENLENNSKKDSLTGLWNRAYLEEYFQTKKSDEQGYLLMLDLDNFKNLNDTFGHIAGDNALAAFADAMLRLTSKDDILCRIGGDEFVIVIKGNQDKEDIIKLAKELIAGVEISINANIDRECDNVVSVSIGIVRFPADGADFAELYNHADKALYFVKQNGRHGYYFYQDDYRTLSDYKNEYSQIDMEQLKNLISETNLQGGAYHVEYEGFKRIYRYINRFAERTHQNVQIVLFSLESRNQDEVEEELLDNAMFVLDEHIVSLLRRADAATRFSKTQFVVILMDTTMDNGMIAVNRVLDCFAKSEASDYFELKYEIQNITHP